VEKEPYISIFSFDLEYTENNTCTRKGRLHCCISKNENNLCFKGHKKVKMYHIFNGTGLPIHILERINLIFVSENFKWPEIYFSQFITCYLCTTKTAFQLLISSTGGPFKF
jgi:hypothetical protein